MGSASDRSPDPTRTTNWARPPLPTGSHGTASTPSSPAPPPSGRQPKLPDRLRDALHARQYSPRTEQRYRRTMLPEAVKGPLREHLVRMRQIHQQDLTERYGSGSPDENARRSKMQPYQKLVAGVRRKLRPRLRLPTAPNQLLLVAFMPLATWRLMLTLGQFGGHRRKPDNP